MKNNDKINVAAYLKSLNETTNHLEELNILKKSHVEHITCKILAKKCNVTTATISNLTTSSKFSLIYKIANEILDAYYPYFSYLEEKQRINYPNIPLYAKSAYYIILSLTEFY